MNAIFLFNLKNPFQAHSAKKNKYINLNSLLRKELAKIIISHNLKDSKAHLQLEIRKLQMNLYPYSTFLLKIQNLLIPSVQTFNAPVLKVIPIS